jgi:hypothetical protein
LAKNVGIVKEVDSDGIGTSTMELSATNMNGVVDFDGDGKIDIGVYRNGSWSIVQSSNGATVNFVWGGASWFPVVSDYVGDGIADVAVRNPSNGLWSIVRSSDGGNTLIGWTAAANDIPVPADFDGDGKADLAVRCVQQHNSRVVDHPVLGFRTHLRCMGRSCMDPSGSGL